MGIVTNVITPIIKGVFLVAFIGGGIIGSIWFFMKYVITKKRRLWMKFHIFRKKYPEDQVAWCLDAIEKGHDDPHKLRKFLLTRSKFPLSKIEQVLFIFEELEKLKGGNAYGRKIRQGRSEDQFPKIKEESEE